MRPELFHIGPIPIYAYGFMILLGFLMGMKIGAARFKAKGMAPELIYDIGLIAMVTGILGARLFYLVQYRHTFDWTIFALQDGISYFGGLLGLMVWAAGYRHPFAWKYLAFTALGLILARYKNLIQPLSGQFHFLDLIFLGMTVFFLVQNWVPMLNAWKQGTTKSRRRFAIGALAAMVIGMRGLYCCRFAARYSWDVFAIWNGGLVFYGGFVVGTVALMIFFKRQKLPILKVSDILAPSLALGLAFTRIGCFLNGCCFGAMCAPDAPYGIHFPAYSLAGQNQNLRGLDIEYLWKAYAPANLHHIAQLPGGRTEILNSLHHYLPREIYDILFLPVYPTQLIASLNGFIVFALLLWFYRYRKHDGEILLLFGIVYSILRFGEEMLRNDTAPVFGTALTVSQTVSYGLFCVCGGIFIFLRSRGWLFARGELKKHGC